MNKLLRYSALAVFVGGGMGVAHADDATTTGGIKIKSSDGNFDASIGGRIHFDGEVIIPDHGAAFGVNNPSGGEKSSFYFRRVFLSLAGHLYGWEYHIDEDLASTSNPGNGFNDVWIAHSVLGGDTVYLGQHKPWRSMDEMASNNITPFMERNDVSGVGIYGGRDFADGLFYKWTHGFTGHDNLFAGASFYTLNKLGTSGPSPSCTVTVTGGTAGETATCKVSGAGSAVANNTQGTGYNARIAYAPIVQDNMWAHIGVSYSSDNADQGGFGSLNASYIFVGRQAANITLANYGSPASTGGNPHVDTVHGELAGAFGPAFVLGEYAHAHFSQEGQTGNNVTALTGTVGYAITGETRPYDKNVATYGGIKPKHSFGAVEVVARYDFMRNNCSGGLCVGVASASGNNIPAAFGAVNAAHLSTISAGVNYYVNPGVRFMLDYEHGSVNGSAAAGSGKDQPNSVEGRVQIAF